MTTFCVDRLSVSQWKHIIHDENEHQQLLVIIQQFIIHLLILALYNCSPSTKNKTSRIISYIKHDT